MSNGDTNFKNYDPKKQHSEPENRKDRGANYEDAKNFDPTHGHKDVTDERATTELDEGEDEEDAVPAGS